MRVSNRRDTRVVSVSAAELTFHLDLASAYLCRRRQLHRSYSHSPSLGNGGKRRRRKERNRVNTFSESSEDPLIVVGQSEPMAIMQSADIPKLQRRQRLNHQVHPSRITFAHNLCALL